MRKILILASCISGCAIQPKSVPLPPPNEKCITIPGQGCRKISAGDVGGTTLGNRDETVLEEINR